MRLWHEPTDERPDYDRRAWIIAAVVLWLVTLTMAYAQGLSRGDRLDYALVARTIDNAEAALAVCGEEDERLHELLRERAGVVWRADEP
jgi:hypothetical protein